MDVEAGILVPDAHPPVRRHVVGMIPQTHERDTVQRVDVQANEPVQNVVIPPEDADNPSFHQFLGGILLPVVPAVLAGTAAEFAVGTPVKNKVPAADAVDLSSFQILSHTSLQFGQICTEESTFPSIVKKISEKRLVLLEQQKTGFVKQIFMPAYFSS